MSGPVRCPGCGREFPFPPAAAGRAAPCPGCGRPVRPAAAPEHTLAAPPGPPAAAPAAPLVGDRYELVKELGRGAFGVVWKARDTRLRGKSVAVKMLLERALATPDAVRRFRAEAELLCDVQHAHVPPVLDYGEYQGQQYIVFAFVEGRTVRECIPPGGFPDPADAVRLAAKLVRTLHDIYAAKRLLHRDVKPANMMVPAKEQGGLYLMDFGLAVCHDTDEGRTQEGTLLGTPWYMSPEQAAGRIKDTGHATDLYAAAAVLYHLLTGRPPFNSKMPAILYEIQSVPPDPPSLHRPGLDPELDRLVLRGLEKRPEDRYRTGADFAHQLDLWVARATVGGPKVVKVKVPAGPPGRNPGSVTAPPAPLPPEAESARAESTAGGSRHTVPLPPRPPARPPAAARSGVARPVGPPAARSGYTPAQPTGRSAAAKVGLLALAVVLLAGCAYGVYAVVSGGKTSQPTAPFKGEKGKWYGEK